MDHWKSISSRLTGRQQEITDSLFQLSTHEENVAQFRSWLQDAEHRMKRNSELQPTLQAKKAALQNNKVILLLVLLDGYIRYVLDFIKETHFYNEL